MPDDKLLILTYYPPITDALKETRLKNVVNLLSDEDLIGHMLGTIIRPAGVLMSSNSKTHAAGISSINGSLHASNEVIIELWGHEACPYSRIIREFLCVEQLPYILQSQAIDKTPSLTLKLPGGDTEAFELHTELEAAATRVAEAAGRRPDTSSEDAPT